MKTKATFLISVLAAVLAAAPTALAEPASIPVPVGVDNFIRAETDSYFGNLVKAGGLGKFSHRREPASIEHQDVIRMNRDTLYSSAVFDLDAGPVTIKLPDAGGRFMAMMIVNQDHYVTKVIYEPGLHSLDKKKIGTRYAAAAIRTLVDPANPDDVKQVHALQDAIQARQADVGKFEVPAWDPVSRQKVRDALLVLSSTLPSFSKAFGARTEVDPVHHLIGTASGWGGNPDKDATYLNVTPPQNDGVTAYKLVVKDVPVDAFWSISVYNEQGYFEKNPENAYSVNSITGKKSADGSMLIQFGGQADPAVNHLPIVKGWNYAVRLYRPRAEILNGTWKFPEAQPMR